MRGARAEELRENFVKLEPQYVEPLSQHRVGGPGLSVSVGPGVDQSSRGLESVGETDRDLVLIGGRATFYAGNADAVFAGLLQPDRSEIGDAVRRDVIFRIAHLVHQLLSNAGYCDSPAGSRVFCDHEGSVLAGLDNRVADVPEIGDRLPIDLAIAARRLRAAFDDVTGDRPGGDLVPVVESPAEFVDHRA